MKTDVIRPIVIILVASLLLFLTLSQVYTTMKATRWNIINECGASDNYVSAVDSEVSKAYDKYTEMFGVPPAFGGIIRLTNNMPSGVAGQAMFSCSSTGCIVTEIRLRCNLGSELAKTVWHEMAHAMQATFMRGGEDYGWWTESSAEALANYGLSYYGYFYHKYFYGKYWTKNPFALGEWSEEYYVYVPPIIFSFKYWSPKDVFPKFAQADKKTIGQMYLFFLLSAWNWWNYIPQSQGPQFDDSCTMFKGEKVDAYTAVYCRYYPPDVQDAGLVLTANAYMNATKAYSYFLVAFAPDVSVTLSYTHTLIPPTATVTTTVTTTTTKTETVTSTFTTTTTETETVTVPVTTTYTTTIPVTYTTTVTLPVTYTTTTTVPVTYTTTETVTTTITTPVTYTTTTTVPITYTTTEIVTTTYTTTTTVPVTYTTTTTVPVTYTTTSTVIVEKTTTTTVTTTVVERGVDWNTVIAIVIIAAILACIACGAAKKSKNSES